MLHAFALAACFTPVPQSLDGSVRALLKEGDVLSNGAVVSGFLDIALADNGTWAAIVVAGSDRHLVRNGTVIRSEGDTVQGAVIDLLIDVELSRDGVLGVRYEVEDPSNPGSTLTRIQIGPNVILEEGQVLSNGPIGLFGTVRVISGFDFDGVEVAVACSVAPMAGGASQFTYLVGSIGLVGTMGALGFVPTGGYLQGNAVPGLGEPFYSASGDLDYGGSSTSGAVATLQSSNSGLFGVIIDGVGVAESGEPGYTPSSTWTFDSRPRVRVNNVGQHVIAGTIELSNGNNVGAVFRGGPSGTQAIAFEGGAPGGVIGDGLSPFDSLSIELADDGTVVYVASFQSGTQRLMAGSDEVIRTGVSEASGFVVTSLFAATLGDRLSISSDGRELLLVGELAGVGDALLLAERALEEPVACTVTANSTGLEGRLAADGSRYVFVNDLEIVASALPPFQFSLLVASLDTAFVPNPGGSSGNLCLGGAIGRFNSEIQLASSIGIARYDVDLTLIPQPSTVVAAAPGETWYFQVWHRDLNASGQTSNLTRAISVLMR